MSEPTYTWVDTPEELARLVERLADVDEVALDTEFVFERTYWPRPGVVQLAADGEIALVDAVGLDLVSLAGVVGSSTVRKLIHAGSGDAVVLERTTGVRPAGVFDTQIAAAFAGLGAGISYEALVRTLLGVSLGKHHTRTDWTRRPLSTEQLHYAAEDVLHLGTVAAELRARLVALGRLAWAEEDSVASMAVEPGADDPEQAWTRIRGAERLPPVVRARAQALAAWRDREARGRDLPKTFLLRDESLLELAWRPVLDPEALGAVRGFEARRHGPFAPAVVAVLELVAAAPAADGDEVRPRAPSGSLDRAVAGAVEKVAAELALPPELLLSRRGRTRLLTGLAAGESPASRLVGWRRDLL
ncbi:MAG: HRDC domain-containing protein, partial [Burkholderiales bacterium]|nr:HRDC domain-containing protein [Burkholderiales bacterium]